MRVLFLTLYPDAAASPRYRVTQFLPYLEAHGITCHVAAPLTVAEWRALTGPDRQGRAFWYHARETPRRLRQIFEAHRYDVVFLQKAVMSAYLRGAGAWLRRRAHRLVFDLDDAVHLTPPHPLRGVWRVLEDHEQVLRLMRTADLVLAGNHWLESQAVNAGGRAVYFPTVVDTNRFVPARAAPEPLALGWMGSPGTTPHLDVLAPVWPGQAGCRLLLVGADARRLAWTRAGGEAPPGLELRPWSYDREVEDVQGMSAGLMPMPKDTWSLGKCGLKALLYMACGIPCVATPYGAALDMVRPGENGLLADTAEEWAAALEMLRDAPTRARLGAAARATVEAQYALRAAAPRLLELLEQVV